MKKLITILAMMVMTSSALAQPSITGASGSYTEGGSVVISGSSFGTKSPAAPLRWLSFDGYTPGNGDTSVDVLPDWDGGGLDKYITVTGRGQSFQNTYARYSGDVDALQDYSEYTYVPGQAFGMGWQINHANGVDLSRLYVSTYLYQEDTDCGEWSRNRKILGNFGTYDADPCRANTYCGHTVYSSCSAITAAPQSRADISYPNGAPHPQLTDACNQNAVSSSTGTPQHVPWGEWVHIERIMDQDRYVGGVTRDRYLMNESIQFDVSGEAWNIERTPPDPEDNGTFDTFNLGHYHSTEYSTYTSQLPTESDPCYKGVDQAGGNYAFARYYYSEVYIDTTFSRVEVGNNETYENCTHKEIQIPSSWSSNEITITFHKGSLTSGSIAWLYITDADQTVNSSGYPILLGSEAAPGSPGQPQHLTAEEN